MLCAGVRARYVQAASHFLSKESGFPVDLKTIGTFNLGALVAGVVSLILSFISSYVVASTDVPGAGNFSAGVNAWDSYATLGILLVIIATVLVAVKVFAAQSLPAGVPVNLIALVAAALGTVLLILRALTYSGGFGVDVGPGWSGYLLFVSTIALTVFTALSFKSSGEQLPNRNAGGHNPPPAGPPAP